MIENCIPNASGNHFEKIKNLPKDIVDCLFNNSPNLWKLLYYKDPTIMPLEQADLSNTQKATMICSTPTDMYDTNVSVTKNILFQMEVDEAFSASVPQIRICTGRKGKIDPYRGWCEVYFQIVIPNKQLLVLTAENSVADRSDLIVIELMKALDQKILPNSVVNSPLFMDKNAPDGTGRNTGCNRDVQNKNFSGQYLTLVCLI